MAGQLSFEIITLEGLAYEAEVYEVDLPTREGRIGVLLHHVPLLTIVAPGVVSVKRNADDTEADMDHLAVSGGFAEVDGKRLRLLADTAEIAEEIDELKAKEAYEKAQQMLAAARDQVSVREAQGLVESQAARIKVAELKRRHRRTL